MSAHDFQFLELPRKMPKELPVAVRVHGWSEIYGSFEPWQSVLRMEMPGAQLHSELAQASAGKSLV